MEVLEGCVKMPLVMILRVAVNNGSEACIGSPNWSIDKRQLCNIVFVNHSEDWSLWDSVDSWILQVILL